MLIASFHAPFVKVEVVWKQAHRRKKNLIRLGVSNDQAYAWSRTRMGVWSVAQSPIMITTITLERLVKRGYESLLAYYQHVAPQLNEPSDGIGMV